MRDNVEVMLVDDDDDVLRATRQLLELADCGVRTASSADAALSALNCGWSGVVITDVRMPGMNGLAFLDHLHEIDPEVPVILFTGHGDIRMAIDAIRRGAWDFLEKPVDPDHLMAILMRALRYRALTLENRALRLLRAEQSGLDARIVGRSPAIDAVRRTILNLADADVDVLILGETGTGKELVARSLHECGSRCRGNFVALNCGALPESLVESELFGHEPGAFTGAQGRRIGKLEHANGGTLFLDEVESMPMQVQVKLLRVLQERVLERLGSNRQIPLDFRVVAATKIDLHRRCAEGLFREDLLYRLDIASIALPPLRERREDIPLLFQMFLDDAAIRYNRPAPPMPAGCLGALSAHDWPGNVRELRNAAERHVLGLPDARMAQVAASPDRSQGLAEQTAQFEREVIGQMLTVCGGSVSRAADRLGILRKTLYLKMNRYGLHRSFYLN